MKKLQPSESELVGKWVSQATGIGGDEVCDRIEWLISKVLEHVGVDEKSGGWDKLYRDSDDGRYWLLYYPKSYMQGGGPPALKHLPLSDIEAKEKFISAEDWKKRLKKFTQEKNIKPAVPEKSPQDKN